MMWKLKHYKVPTYHRIHSISLNDSEYHAASLQCPCKPLADPGGSLHATHHAWDCREAQERQGYPTHGKQWANILEYLEP